MGKKYFNWLIRERDKERKRRAPQRWSSRIGSACGRDPLESCSGTCIHHRRQPDEVLLLYVQEIAPGEKSGKMVVPGDRSFTFGRKRIYGT